MSTNNAIEGEDILQFSPPAESDNGSWLRDYNEEQETRAALEELGRTYLSEMPETLYELRAQIEAAIAAGADLNLLESATTTAHQIKGTAGSLGFHELSRLAGEIEKDLKEATLDCETPERQPLIKALVVVADIEAWLEAWQDNNKSWVNPTRPMPLVGESESEEGTFVWENPACEASLDISGTGLKLVFVVDANLLRAQSLAGLLRRDGQWQVEILPGGVKVLAALEDCRPDVLILDAEGEDLSGFDICRMIRCHPKWADLSIILLTEDTSVQCREAIFQCGASDFVVKPVVEHELLSRLACMQGSKFRRVEVDYKTA